MKCFILKKGGEYVFMFIQPHQLDDFYSQHSDQILVEADDLEEALRAFGKLPR